MLGTPRQGSVFACLPWVICLYFDVVEEWKPVEGTHFLYWASSYGRFLRRGCSVLENGRWGSAWLTKEEKIYVPVLSGPRGYYRVRIGTKLILLHRIIAKTFLPNPQNKREVNHINGIKTDNRLSNLEWATRSENARHAYKTGLLKMDHFIGERNKTSKLKDFEVLEIKKSLALGENRSHLARKYKVGFHTINDIFKGVTWKHIK